MWKPGLIVVAVLAAAPVARAQAPDPAARQQAKSFADRAAVHYRLGQFREALDGYSRAYELFRAPELLFNIGQCHFSLGNWERAIFFFQGYLRDKPGAANQAVVEDLLREAQKNWDDQKAREKAEREQVQLEGERRLTEARRREAEARRLAAERRLAADRADAAAREREERDKPVYRHWWFWGVVGAGVAVAAGGAVWALSGTDTVLPGGSLGTVDGR